MDVWRITVAVLRRWYVFLPLLVLTGYATVTLGNGVKPQYEVTATAVLVPGQTSPEVENPIENPYGSLNDTAEVLSIILDDARVRGQIEAQGLNGEFEFAPHPRSRIMDFVVLSDSEAVSLQTGETVLEMARQELAERQGAVGIPEGAQIGLQVLQEPAVSDVVAEGKLRIMAVVGILGAALSLLMAVLFDDLVGLLKRWLRRWRERRTAKHVQRDGSAAPDTSSEIGEEGIAEERAPDHQVDTYATRADSPYQQQDVQNLEPASQNR